MTIEIAIILGVILLAFILFVTEALPIDVVALSLLGFLFLGKFLTPEEALSGFANPAVITIAGLFIISHALQKSGVLEYVILKLNRVVSHSKLLGLSAYLLSIAFASAIVNNTAIVAIFMPVTIRLAHKYRISPSKVLIPLSYAAILGGTLTLVGTSTNLLVNSILISFGEYQPLGMFEFTKYGIISLFIGLIYILFVAYRLLPSRTVTSSLTKNYHMGGFLTEMKIMENSPLVGQTCLERRINQDYDVMVLDIMREKKLITTNIRNTVLQAGDVLFVKGAVDNFLRMKEVEKVALLTDEKLTHHELSQADNVLVECLLSENSFLLDRSLMDTNFRRRFGSFVLAIRREGAIFRRKIAHIVLRAFDTLLIYGPRDKINEMASTGDFIVLEELENPLKKPKYWWMSLVVITAAVTFAAVGVMSILKGVLIGAILLMIMRVVTPNESYNAIHWQVIVLIAALIPLGIVMQTSGTADWIGSLLINLVGEFPETYRPYALLAMIYLVTMILTEVSSNAATAIIMTPIAIVASTQSGLNPRPFVFAICFAASASFITPVGYQTNLMVYGPGGYKFTDYMKVGFPLGLLLWLVATVMIPILWPFNPLQ